MEASIQVIILIALCPLWAACHRAWTGSYLPLKPVVHLSKLGGASGWHLRENVACSNLKLEALVKDELCLKPLGEPHLLKARQDSSGLLTVVGGHSVSAQKESLSLPIRCAMVLNKAVTSDYHPSLSTGRGPWNSAYSSRSWVWIQTPSGLRTLSNACTVHAVKETFPWGVRKIVGIPMHQQPLTHCWFPEVLPKLIPWVFKLECEGSSE